MKKNLSFLDQERLDIIFDHVYDCAGLNVGTRKFSEEKLSDLLETLISMQSFNYRHRPDDTLELFGLMEEIFNFESNSDGTALWLSLILAIRELYGFSDSKLVTVMKQISIRK